jgi:N-acetylmuramoyl-L-alanine amidase
LKLLILDSGHNEYVIGKEAPDKSLREWVFNNDMQYKIKKRAEDHGITVYLTNPKPQGTDEIGLSKRATLANNYWSSNNKPKSIFISLHANAFSNTTARGTETFHASNASTSSKNFAKTLNDEVVKTMQSLDRNAKNRGVKSQDFTVIYKTSMPSVLVEYGFYTNLDDLKILKNNQDDLTEATIKAICSYFNVAYKEPSSVTTKPTENAKIETWYRAVCGSFKNKEAAEDRIKELSSKGFEGCFIVAFEKQV